jgi:hypothetical protein
MKLTLQPTSKLVSIDTLERAEIPRLLRVWEGTTDLCHKPEPKMGEPAVPPVPAEPKGTCQNGGYWSEITPHQKTPECVGWKLSPVPAEPRLTVKQAAEKAGVEIASKPHRNWKSAGEVDVREFVNPTEPPTDKSEYSSEYPDPKNASSMSTVDLIEWIAQIAYDGKDWGWIKDELMRRFPVPAEPRSAEQFYYEWRDARTAKEASQSINEAIAFAEAYAQSIREQLAAQKELYELRLENKQSGLDEADKAIEILQAKLSAIREQLATAERVTLAERRHKEEFRDIARTAQVVMNWLKRNSANLWMVVIVVPLATWLSLQVLAAHAQKPEPPKGTTLTSCRPGDEVTSRRSLGPCSTPRLQPYKGAKCVVLIAGVCVTNDQDQTEFERTLREFVPKERDRQVFDLRHIL